MSQRNEDEIMITRIRQPEDDPLHAFQILRDDRTLIERILGDLFSEDGLNYDATQRDFRRAKPFGTTNPHERLMERAKRNLQGLKRNGGS